MTESLAMCLQEQLLICDGAMGSELATRGVVCRNSTEANLSAPEVVAAVHRDYRQAGAQVFLTNTFAGNALMLERAGLSDQAVALQTAAVRLLREAVGPEALVALNVGPTGHLLEPLGNLPRADAIAAYRRQLEVMLPLGVDLVLLETFEDLAEVEAALEAVQEADCSLPVAATMSFSSPQGVTMMGVNGEQAARRLASLGADVIGANCGHPDGLLTALGRMAEVTDKPLLAKPNAGVPELVEGRTVYRQGPEEFGRFAEKLIATGVRMLGGCCGSTPAHIRQLARLAQAGA